MKHLFVVIAVVALLLVGSIIGKQAASKLEQIKTNQIATLNAIK